MMCFLCDGMLGRLAHWLRILGFDTAYAQADNHALVRQARAENRTLLTRDTQLAQRRGIDALLIQSDVVEDQIRQVLSAFNLTPSKTFSRCPVCNTPLQALPGPAAEARVPPYVFHTQTSFQECPGCQRVYWRGSHWENMQDRLNGLDIVE